MKRFISRRDFLKVTGAVGAGSLLAACGGSSSSTGTGAASAGDTAVGVSEKKLTVTGRSTLYQIADQIPPRYREKLLKNRTEKERARMPSPSAF